MRYFHFLPISMILMSSLIAKNPYQESTDIKLDDEADLYLSENEYQDQGFNNAEDFLAEDDSYVENDPYLHDSQDEYIQQKHRRVQQDANSIHSKKAQRSHSQTARKSPIKGNQSQANQGYRQSHGHRQHATHIVQANDNAQNQPSQKASSSPAIQINTPTRPVVKNGYNLWFMGDVLLWQATEENLTYIYSGNENNSNQTNRTLHTVDFDWDWGFRLGAGYNIPRDGWDVDLIWTHIRNNGSGDQSGPPDSAQNPNGKGLDQVWIPAGSVYPGSVVKASGHWNVHLDQLDLGLGRSFYVGNHLTLRPFIGMRSTWIFQELKVNMLSNMIPLGGGVSKKDAKMKNKFWGFGFAGGLGSDWQLGKGFSLFGDVDIAALLGFFDIDQHGTLNGAHLWDIDKSFRAGRCIVDLDLGVKWFRLFCKDRFGLTLKAAYEYHLYFDQNQFLLSSGSTNLELWYPASGNLIYQGVSGSIQFDF